MKFTQYFHAMRLRPDRAIIKIEWFQHVIEHPVKELIQQDGRICRWGSIDEVQARYLRVILLPDGETVHNAFWGPEMQAMKIKYFQDTDTLYIEFRSVEAAETEDLDENTLLDFDRDGNMCNGCNEYRGREDCSQKGFVGVLKNEPRHEYQLLNPRVGCTKLLPAGIMRKVPVAASHLDFLAQQIIEVGVM